MVARHGHEPVRLGPAQVSEIHQQGGTMLGTSRGSQDPGEMVDTLEALGIGVLFVIGGDGTLRGADADRRRDRAARAARSRSSASRRPSTTTSTSSIAASASRAPFAAAVEAIRSAHVEATGRAQRHRPGEADGAPLGLHRLPRGARVDRRELRAHPRGAAAPRRRARLPAQPGAAAGGARARRHRRRRGRRPGAVRRRRRRRRRRRDRRQRQRRASRTSASCCATASRGTFASAASTSR